MPFARSRRAALGAVAVSLALAGAPAFASAPSDTTISVSPRIMIPAPGASPADFPGVAKVREGRPLPRGWVVVGRDVRITRGAEPAFAALRLTCPKGRTWRSGATSGDIGASVLDRAPRGKRSVLVMATFSTTAVRAGESAAGTVYALCH